MKVVLGKNKKWVIKENVKELVTEVGKIKIWQKKAISNFGEKFGVIEPCLIDFLEKKLRRGAQIISPKDAALILAYTGIKPKSKIVDIGGGSGFLSIFLAWFLNESKITVYERDERWCRIIRENLKIVGLKNVRVKKADAFKGISEKNVDLITVDVKYPEKVVKFAYKSLKVGGWLVFYCPVIEEVIKLVKEIEKYKFTEPVMVENVVREWKVKEGTRPKTKGLLHTGFLLFTRKFS